MAAVELPSAAARKAAQAAADAAAQAEPAPLSVDQKKALADHNWRIINAWASSVDAQSAQTRQTSVAVPVVGQLDEATVAEWEAMLHAKGFLTERVGRLFIVKLPA